MTKYRSLKWIAVVLLVALPVAVVVILRVHHASDPCMLSPMAELTARYPGLKKLQQQQLRVTEALLARQRAQDIVINLKMNSAQVSPEQALQLSMQQVGEVAALRKHQQQEFIALCHKLDDYPD